MYGILSFEKSTAAASGLRDVRDDGWCGRGSACEGCRISRVRCTGRLNATHCDRCKRLSKACRYITNSPLGRHSQQNQRKDYHLFFAPGDGDGRAPRSGRVRSAGETMARGPGTAPASGAVDKDKPPSLAPDGEAPPPPLVAGDAAPLMMGFVEDDAWWQGLDLAPVASSDETLWSSSLALLDTSDDHDAMSAGIDEPEPSAASDEADPRPAPRLRAATMSPASSSPQQRIPATANCPCLQALTSSLFALRNWRRDTNPEVEGRPQGDRTARHGLEGEMGSFLVLFEESTAQLRVVEDCPLACVLSPELAILLLLAVEQLARFLLGSEPPGRCSGLPWDPAPPARLEAAEGTKAPEDSPLNDGQLHRFGTIGAYPLRDAIDQRMVVKTLLEIRAYWLHGFVARLGSKMATAGLMVIELDLRRVQEDLGQACLRGNEAAYATVKKSSARE